ncbi:MAG: hypothetical protein KME32_19805 [Mojavia pulchra JT2-VF2]|jgi:hypothetical protein|uniref:Uncharacterized protein n=1 Tax=Mojavia pulchra JT2-VF2 TaxID=287848 RepID=A0A951Q238_9NOST|nr:hypothetical protein [Mojavia pulchra JT2-VF2]
MESTLFTTLNPNEEANISGGKRKPAKVRPVLVKVDITQSADGGDGGDVTLSLDDKSKIIKSTITLTGGAGGDGGTNTVKL